MTLISALCLFTVGVLCIMGLLSCKYRDNWLQFFGLVGLCVWSFGRSNVMLDRWLDGVTELGVYQFVSHVSLALFGLGTAMKVWKFR